MYTEIHQCTLMFSDAHQSVLVDTDILYNQRVASSTEVCVETIIITVKNNISKNIGLSPQGY